MFKFGEYVKTKKGKKVKPLYENGDNIACLDGNGEKVFIPIDDFNFGDSEKKKYNKMISPVKEKVFEVDESLNNDTFFEEEKEEEKAEEEKKKVFELEDEDYI
jgi:valyl-tRNA synthetase